MSFVFVSYLIYWQGGLLNTYLTINQSSGKLELLLYLGENLLQVETRCKPTTFLSKHSTFELFRCQLHNLYVLTYHRPSWYILSGVLQLTCPSILKMLQYLEIHVLVLYMYPAKYIYLAHMYNNIYCLVGTKFNTMSKYHIVVTLPSVPASPVLIYYDRYNYFDTRLSHSLHCHFIDYYGYL